MAKAPAATRHFPIVPNCNSEGRVPNYGFYGHCPGGKSRVVLVLEGYTRRVSLHVRFGNRQLMNHKAPKSQYADSRLGNYRIRFCRLNIFLRG